MNVITEIEDLRALAKKRVPRMFYEFADSGSWTESTFRSNEADFRKILLRQRVALNLEGRSLKTKMIDIDVAMPVAIAPTGLACDSFSLGRKVRLGRRMRPLEPSPIAAASAPLLRSTARARRVVVHGRSGLLDGDDDVHAVSHVRDRGIRGAQNIVGEDERRLHRTIMKAAAARRAAYADARSRGSRMRIHELTRRLELCLQN